jgi:prepilin-type processing-associated H-X9-DG protein
LLSARHDREFENLADKNRGRGNAGFCDGHVEVITREDSFKPEYWKPSQP